jgi:hypothetical protein
MVKTVCLVVILCRLRVSVTGKVSHRFVSNRMLVMTL